MDCCWGWGAPDTIENVKNWKLGKLKSGNIFGLCRGLPRYFYFKFTKWGSPNLRRDIEIPRKLVTFNCHFQKNNFIRMFLNSWKCLWPPETITLKFRYTELHKTIQGNPESFSGNSIFENLGISKPSMLEDACRQFLEIRLIRAWQSWIWDQHPPNNIKWKFCIFQFNSRNLNIFLISN